MPIGRVLDLIEIVLNKQIGKVEERLEMLADDLDARAESSRKSARHKRRYHWRNPRHRAGPVFRQMPR